MTSKVSDMNKRETAKIDQLVQIKDKSERIKEKAKESAELSKQLEEESRKYLAALNFFLYGLIGVGVLFLVAFVSKFVI